MKNFEATIITKNGEVFNKAIITSTHVFYTDDYDGCKMFSIDGKGLDLEGELANDSYNEAVWGGNVVWASENDKYNIFYIAEEANECGNWENENAKGNIEKLLGDYQPNI